MKTWRAVMLVVLACVTSGVCAGSALCGWQTFGVGDGLPGWDVLGLFEDRDENLWFITNWGIALYDGVTWRNFTAADGLGGTAAGRSRGGTM